MQLRIVLLIMAFLPVLYDLFTLRIIDRKRQEPLPAEVSDVYTEERWKLFTAHKHDLRVPHYVSRLWSFLLDAVMILSPFFMWMERMSGGNVYVCVAVTVLFMTAVPLLVDVPLSWYRSFRIDQKYGLNKQTPGEFIKDTVIDTVGGFGLNLALYELITYVLLHMDAWTNGYTVPAGRVILLACGLAAVFGLFIFGAAWIAWRLMRMRYVFKPLEEGELKDSILKLLKGSRHRVRRIEVYNESSKSPRKNAFVLKLPFYRSIGIADNFLSENSRDELLGVLAHEAGHLKHRPDIRNIIAWALRVCLVLLIPLAIGGGRTLVQMELYAERVFGLSVINPVLTSSIVLWLATPLMFPFSVFSNYVSRCEEYEADRNAVHEGYGEPLIRTFKEISTDELVDVNPADIIEFLEYDHPGMYHRICAIRSAMQKEGN